MRFWADHCARGKFLSVSRHLLAERPLLHRTGTEAKADPFSEERQCLPGGATDFQNRIYRVNPVTGAATLIGATGVPAIPFVPATLNDDGTINFYEEALFGAGGNLYATFDAFAFDLATSSVASVAVAPALYQIDPSTGRATVCWIDRL